MWKKEIQEKKKILGNIISVYVKENGHTNLLNYDFFTIYPKNIKP